MKRFLAILLSVVVFWACSKDESTSSAPLANSITYNPTNVFVKTVTDVFLVPTAKYPEGTYTITPTLPEGLWFNAQSGAIAGIPQVVSPITTYTVTLTNSSGSVTTNFTITVNDKAPNLNGYSMTSSTFSAGHSVVILTPVLMASSTPVISYSVSPALPAGLSLNPQTGVISGTPTVVTPATSYTITATNSGGTSSTTISIRVDPFYGRIKAMNFWDPTNHSYLMKAIRYFYTNGLISEISNLNDTYSQSYYDELFYYAAGKLNSKTSQSGNRYSLYPGSTTTYNYTNDFITSYSNSYIFPSTGLYTYTNGNLATYTINSGQGQFTYNYDYFLDGNLHTITLSGNATPGKVYGSYDNKHNPLRNSGFTSEYLAMEAVPFNNPLSDGNKTYTYEYNAEDYPTVRYTYNSSGELVEYVTYEYE